MIHIKDDNYYYHKYLKYKGKNDYLRSLAQLGGNDEENQGILLGDDTLSITSESSNDIDTEHSVLFDPIIKGPYVVDQFMNILSQLNRIGNVNIDKSHVDFIIDLKLKLEQIKNDDHVNKTKILKTKLPISVGRLQHKTIELPSDTLLKLIDGNSSVVLKGNLIDETKNLGLEDVLIKTTPSFVSIGTSGIARKDNVTLANMYDIDYTLEASGNIVKTVKSFRYGTTLNQDKAKQHAIVYNHLNGSPTPHQGKKILIISLLDTCLQVACKVGKTLTSDLNAKQKEMEIVKSEIEFYKDKPNVVFFHLLLNAMVNNERSLTIDKSEGLRGLISNPTENAMKIFEDRFESWIRNIPHVGIFLSKIYKNTFAPEMKTNDVPKNLNTILTENFADRLMLTNVNGANKQLVREFARYYVTCFLCLIQNILSDTSNIILAYHCKSGMDRTGTFYAINQMVTSVYNTNKYQIMRELKSLATSQAANSYNCNLECERLFMTQVMRKYFDNVLNAELLQKHMYMAYLVTWLSTGIPGIKWSLGKSAMGFSLENGFSYLVSNNANISELNTSNTKILEGLSSFRGS